jgi:hypothetical protein
MKFFSLSALFVAALVSGTVVVPFLPEAKANSEQPFALEAKLSSTTAGSVQLFYDSGSGFSEAASSHFAVPKGGDWVVCRLPIPRGRFRALRLDPMDHPGAITIESLRIVGRGNRVVRNIALSELRAAYQIRTLHQRDNRLEVVTAADANDPQLVLSFNAPLTIGGTWGDLLADVVPLAGSVFAALATLLFVLDRLRSIRETALSVIRWSVARPSRAITLVGGLAVILNAYPVVFLGKSFVSPNLGAPLLYDAFPTLPGYTGSEVVPTKGTDVGAIMWSHIPISMMQHRALAGGELPLWNRYNSAGTALLGQGQSMLGDPLHFFVVLANGSAWAWDIKYLIAKCLFAIGLGLLVFALTRHLPSSLIVTFAAPFIGFFYYRLNHPAFFSVCYSPWALYCWVRVTQAVGRRATVLWAGGLVLANIALMNSGTVKEAYVLLVSMNFSGACVLLASNTPWHERFSKLATLTWMGVLFALVTAPFWVTFLNTLGNAVTVSDQGQAFQIQPGLMLGAFDEIFFRPIMAYENTFNPSVNFLILAGLLYFLATLRLSLAGSGAIALAASSLMPLAFAFGFIAPRRIVQVPFLANIGHIDNTFLCALVVLWCVLAGIGFARAAARLGTSEGREDLVMAVLILFALVSSWFGFRHAAHRSVLGPGSAFSPFPGGTEITASAFVHNDLTVLLIALIVLGYFCRRALLRGVLHPPATMIIGLCVIVTLWRHGLHAQAVGFEDYVARPSERVDFHARSEAMEFVRSAQDREPSRALGVNNNLFPGWSGVYQIEGINGPDALVSRYFPELTNVLPGVERIWFWGPYLKPENAGNARPFFDALNVRYYLGLHSDQVALGNSLKLVKSADLDIYESPTAWPRAFFTDRLAVYDQPTDLVREIQTGDGRPFAAAQRADVLRNPRLASLSSELRGRTVVPAARYQLTENTTSFDVHADGPGVIVLDETFWPDDFHAEVNSRSVPIVRLNHVFKGVVVDDAGEYRVTFRYVPKNLSRNLVLSGFGAVLLAGSVFLVLRPVRAALPAWMNVHAIFKSWQRKRNKLYRIRQ